MQKPRPPDDPRLTPVMRRATLIGEGWTDKAIRHMVASQQWVRVRHGAYVELAAWRRTDEAGRHEITARAVLAQASTDVVLSHSSAGAVWDVPFWDWKPTAVDVTRRDARSGRREAGVCQHRGRLLDGDVVELHGVPVVSATRLSLELTLVNDFEHALSYVNFLLHEGHTSKEAMVSRYLASIERWPHSLSSDLVMRLSDPRIETVGESRTCYLCWRQRLPLPEPQFVVYDEQNDEAFRLDFAWPEHGVWLEFDGAVKYTKFVREGELASDVVLREKRREDRIRELTGWRCIRITWADLYKPEHTALRIRRVLFPSTVAA